MIWELRASGTAADIHENLIAKWVAARTAGREADAAQTAKDRETDENAPEVTTWTDEVEEQIGTAMGMAAQLVARTGGLGEAFDVLLRGRTDPGQRGYRISLGEMPPPPEDEAAAAA